MQRTRAAKHHPDTHQDNTILCSKTEEAGNKRTKQGIQQGDTILYALDVSAINLSIANCDVLSVNTTWAIKNYFDTLMMFV